MSFYFLSIVRSEFVFEENALAALSSRALKIRRLSPLADACPYAAASRL